VLADSLRPAGNIIGGFSFFGNNGGTL